ncbi:DUF418 domain-containing protein [Micromonospora tarensis]|uniref:DUF418 domain-containing protein n=1 Tax=Micromonospora tarensis TaxID=2806100 RepID=UPI002814B0C3|nr:DUF418 domain-containing protein [Micromonospora tarensis]
MLIAVTVWLVTVLIARLLHKRGQAGPAEVVLRRLTYGPRRSLAATAAPDPADRRRRRS